MQNGDHIIPVAGSQSAVEPKSGLRPDKVHASLLVRLVEVVVVGDLDGEAVGVFGAGSVVAALGRLARVGVLGLGGEGDVVVDELPPGHQQDRHSVVVEPFVLDNQKICLSIYLSTYLSIFLSIYLYFYLFV